MGEQRRRVRARRSGLPTVAVTGAATALGRHVAARLVDHAAIGRVVAVDAVRGDLPGAEWRVVDVRDPLVAGRLDGVDALVHLALDLRPDAPPAQRRPLNVRGTSVLLPAAVAAGVGQVVLVTSAMVYGAHADNPVPLPDDAPVRAEGDSTLLGDWVEMERCAERLARDHPDTRVAVLRPATLVGPGADSVLTRLFDAPRLLAVRGATPHWQFCHVDDLAEAVAVAVTAQLTGPATVASPGWLGQRDVERLTGLRSVVLPQAVALSMAERLRRIGVLPAPATELGYLAHPWVVGCERLGAAGWQASYTNESALRAHLELPREREPLTGRLVRSDATRAAAGATIAVVGTVALTRRARRRRRG